MNWISVKDRLPDLGEQVVFLYKDVDVHVGRFNELNDFVMKDGFMNIVRTYKAFCNYDDIEFEIDGVTHWLSIPEIPSHKIFREMVQVNNS